MHGYWSIIGKVEERCSIVKWRADMVSGEMGYEIWSHVSCWLDRLVMCCWCGIDDMTVVLTWLYTDWLTWHDRWRFLIRCCSLNCTTNQVIGSVDLFVSPCLDLRADDFIRTRRFKSKTNLVAPLGTWGTCQCFWDDFCSNIILNWCPTCWYSWIPIWTMFWLLMVLIEYHFILNK